jgi:hypothetical protein
VRWPRRLRLPDDVRAALPLQKGEHVLAAAQCVDGTWAVATDRALFVGETRVEWADIAHAEWDDEASLLRIDEMRTSGAAASGRRLPFEDPGFLPETVHERVRASIVTSRHIRIRGRAGVRVVARRVTGSDELRWQVVLDRGLDPEDPQVQALAQAALAELRRELDA